MFRSGSGGATAGAIFTGTAVVMVSDVGRIATRETAAFVARAFFLMEPFVGGEGGERKLVESDEIGKGLSELRGDDCVAFVGTGLLETRGSVVFLLEKTVFFVMVDMVGSILIIVIER